MQPGGDPLLARIAFMKALNRNVVLRSIPMPRSTIGANAS